MASTSREMGPVRIVKTELSRKDFHQEVRRKFLQT